MQSQTSARLTSAKMFGPKQALDWGGCGRQRSLAGYKANPTSSCTKHTSPASAEACRQRSLAGYKANPTSSCTKHTSPASAEACAARLRPCLAPRSDPDKQRNSGGPQKASADGKQEPFHGSAGRFQPGLPACCNQKWIYICALISRIIITITDRSK